MMNVQTHMHYESKRHQLHTVNLGEVCNDDLSADGLDVRDLHAMGSNQHVNAVVPPNSQPDSFLAHVLPPDTPHATHY